MRARASGAARAWRLAMVGRPVQRGLSVLVCRIDGRCEGLHEGADRLGVAPGGGEVQGRSTVAVGGEHVGIALEQQPHLLGLGLGFGFGLGLGLGLGFGLGFGLGLRLGLGLGLGLVLGLGLGLG